MPGNYFMRKFEAMPSLIYTHRFFIALLCAALLLLSGCKKTAADIPQQTLQQYFEETILNKEFVVEYAKDTANDITSDYTGYTFMLTRTTSYTDGPMTGKKNGVTITGTWTSNDDYGKLVINLINPAPPAAFTFLNRSWKFTKKSLPIMELAPWGTTDPKILHMRRL
jgi:hypothetical protein